MRVVHKRRISFAVLSLFVLAIVEGLILYALKQNINLYFTPSQLFTNHPQSNSVIRLGGYVEKKSLHYAQNSLKVQFRVTDFKDNIIVEYEGILPDLFKEGQGVVVQGKLSEQGTFIANQVLAKHDENYKPPNVNYKGKL